MQERVDAAIVQSCAEKREKDLTYIKIVNKGTSSRLHQKCLVSANNYKNIRPDLHCIVCVCWAMGKNVIFEVVLVQGQGVRVWSIKGGF